MQWSSPYKHTFPPLKICGYNTVATTLSRTAAVSIFCSYPALGMDGLDGGAKWCGLAWQCHAVTHFWRQPERTKLNGWNVTAAPRNREVVWGIRAVQSPHRKVVKFKHGLLPPSTIYLSGSKIGTVFWKLGLPAHCMETCIWHALPK